MDAMHVQAYLAIPMPSPEQDQKFRVRLYDTLDELCLLSTKLPFNLFEFGLHNPEIRLLKGKDRNQKQIRARIPFKVLRYREILRFSAEVPLLAEESVRVIPDITAEDRTIQLVGMQRTAIEHFFIKNISNLLILANISNPGSINLSESALLRDGVLQEYSAVPSMVSWNLREAIQLASKMNWPKLEKIDFLRVWNWSNQNSDIMDGFGGLPISRALSAFSHIFEPSVQFEPMQLLWALIGIEALYAKGTTALLDQVREKAYTFLGSQESYKKIIVKMYNFRSRFVHGDLDFSEVYLVGDARENVTRFDDDLLESISVAISVLIATIQEMIRRGWITLNFSYAANGLSS